MAQLAKASDTQTVYCPIGRGNHVADSSLVRTYKISLKNYLEVILYNCVYINGRLSLKPWMPLSKC